MASYIPRYKETKTKIIKMCLSCKFVGELTESTIDCPSCGLVGYLGFWDSPQKFQHYIRIYQPQHLNINGSYIQNLVDEAFKQII